MAPNTPDLQPTNPPTDTGETRPIRTHRVGGVLVLTPDGVLDDHGVADIDQLLRTIHEPVIVDLDDCVLGWSDVLDRLDPVRWGRTPRQVCLVCRRFSARRLLSRAGVAAHVAVFRTIGEAVDAVEADEGLDDAQAASN